MSGIKGAALTRTLAVAGIAAAVGIVSLTEANAQTVDDHTRCGLASAAFDKRDMEGIRDYGFYIENTMDKLDEAHTSQGEPGIISQLSDDGMNGLVAVAISYCRQHPRATIYNAAAYVYRGTRDLELQLGVAK